jgi:hypothetical protein
MFHPMGRNGAMLNIQFDGDVLGVRPDSRAARRTGHGFRPRANRAVYGQSRLGVQMRHYPFAEGAAALAWLRSP